MIQVVFVAELALRLLACWPRPGRFFRDGWNVFDFVIVALSLLPVAGSFATVGRLARLLRVTRLVSVSPDLRLIIGTMLRSIPSMGNVALLLGLLVYVYAIIGFYSFSTWIRRTGARCPRRSCPCSSCSRWRAGLRCSRRFCRGGHGRGCTSAVS
jgi:voltage-gated sodium channel